jgi:NAD(P)-dependent dehydrogenase (short-subunit alcohol dehydrogenase family)
MLSEKVVVVTGGAGLIGQEFVKSIVENNGIGVIADINIGLAEKVRDNLAQKVNGEKIGVVKLDITSEGSLAEGIYHLRNKYKRIDALINNAYPRNKNYGQSFFDVQYNDFVENIGLNLGGYFSASQQFAKYFKEQGGGNIVNISSIYGVIAPRFELYKDTDITTPVEYAVIKSGLIHLTRYMAKYFKGMNIRVNSLSPGGIIDDQPELFLNAYKEKCLNKGMLDASDLKGTLIYLLSDMSQFVNGQNIVVDDGFCL